MVPQVKFRRGVEQFDQEVVCVLRATFTFRQPGLDGLQVGAEGVRARILFQARHCSASLGNPIRAFLHLDHAQAGIGIGSRIPRGKLDCPSGTLKVAEFHEEQADLRQQIGGQALHARPAVERRERVVRPHRFVAADGVLVTNLAVVRRELHRVAQDQ